MLFLKIFNKKQPFPLSKAFRYLARFFDIAILAVYLGIGITMILRHEAWSDEAQPWLMARDMNLLQLLEAMLHNYDRHPAIWYLILFALSHAGLPFFSMAVTNFVFALLAAALFLFKAPFSRVVKYIFLFSFYMIYEYPVIARHYALLVLLIFAAAALYRSRMKHPILFGAVVFLIFNTEYLGFGFAFSVMLLFALDLRRKRTVRAATLAGLSVMIIGAALAVLQGGWLPADHVDSGRTLFGNYIPGFRFVAYTFIPHAQTFPAWFPKPWGFLVLTLAFASFVRKPLWALVLAASVGLLAYVFTFHHIGDLRHYGLIPVILLAVYWMDAVTTTTAAADSPEPSRLFLWEKICKKLALFLLCSSFVISFRLAVIAVTSDYHAFFSGSRHMAEQIKALCERLKVDPKNLVIVAHTHNNAVSVLAYMPGVQFWFPYLKGPATYFLNTKKMQEGSRLSQNEALSIAENHIANFSNALVLLTQTPRETPESANYRYELVVNMAKAPIFGYSYERYYLFRPVGKGSPAKATGELSHKYPNSA